MQNSKVQYYYLFVNTNSGHNLGKSFLTIPEKTLTLITENSQSHVFLYDFISISDREKGLKQAKQQSEKTMIHIIICGGDGTVVWVMSKVHQFGIQTENVIFSVIPIGSGNDFSRTLGWGCNAVLFDEKDIDGLLDLIKKWQNAEIMEYDLWDVKIETYEHGRILQLRDDQDNSQGKKQLNQTFANYFGVGIDGRIAYTSQKNRGNNIVLNKAIYGLVGFFCFFNPAPSIKSLLNKCVTRSDKRSVNKKDQKTECTEYIQLQTSMIDQVSSPQKSGSLLKPENKDQQLLDLKDHWHTIVCLNGKNFMAGVKNIWKPERINNWGQQKFGDSKLQIVGFRNELSLVLQRLINLADNVSQVQGELQLDFKKSQEEPIKTFIQIDGEPMMLVNPKKILVKHSSISKTGKINVLYNNSQ